MAVLVRGVGAWRGGSHGTCLEWGEDTVCRGGGGARRRASQEPWAPPGLRSASPPRWPRFPERPAPASRLLPHPRAGGTPGVLEPGRRGAFPEPASEGGREGRGHRGWQALRRPAAFARWSPRSHPAVAILQEVWFLVFACRSRARLPFLATLVYGLVVNKPWLPIAAFPTFFIHKTAMLIVPPPRIAAEIK
jgi:hypothetical protein